MQPARVGDGVKSETIESVESFRVRAREWVRDNLAPCEPNMPITMTYETARVVQAVIFDGGFAGIAVPTEYGGCGLTPVSYTHLDVYKRQNQTRSSIGRTIIPSIRLWSVP